MAKKKFDVLKATPDAINAVQFVRQFGNQLKTMIGMPSDTPLNPGLRPPIVVSLLQPLSGGEEGLGLILERATVKNAFAVDLFGYYNLTPTFKFKLKVHSFPYGPDGNVLVNQGTVLATTGPIQIDTATADTVRDALIATGAFATADIHVGGGNLITDPNLVNNEALRWNIQTIQPNTLQKDVFSFAGKWFITFKAKRFVPVCLAVEPLRENGQAFAETSIQAVVSVRSTLVSSGMTELVRDIHMVPVTGPLVGGTVCACIDFPQIGYGILTAGTREFYE